MLRQEYLFALNLPRQTPSKRCTGAAALYYLALPKAGKKENNHCKEATPILVLSSPTVSPNPPTPLCNPGLMDDVHRVRGGPRVALRKLAAAADWRDASHCLTYWWATSLSLRTDHHYIIHPIVLQWREWAERTLLRQRQRKTK